MNFIDKMVERFIKLNRRMKRWQRVVSVMAAVVVFATTYALILPAITLDSETASTQAGIEVAASENESDEAGTVFESEEEEPAVEPVVEEVDKATVDENSSVESGSKDAAPSESESDGEQGFVDEDNSNSSDDNTLTADEAANYATTEEAIAAVTGQTAEDVKLITEPTQLKFVDEEEEYTVFADFGEEAKLPEGVQLQVKEITKESDPEAYEMYYEKALGEMQDKYDENTALSFARFYDIAFVYEGVEIEPSGKVNVRIEYKKALEVQKDANVDTIHFDKNDEEKPEVIDSEVNAEKKRKQDIKTVDAVEFESDKFSVYGIVGTETITVDFLTADGETYKITVTFDEREELSGDMELFVSEILEGSNSYNDYLQMTADEMWMESTDSINAARFFNVEIKKDNEKFEPKYPVTISIKHDDAIQIGDDDMLSIIHFADEGTELITDISLNEENTELEYKQNSFSVIGEVVSATREDSIMLIVEGKNGYYAVDKDLNLHKVAYSTSGNKKTITFLENDFPFDDEHGAENAGKLAPFLWSRSINNSTTVYINSEGEFIEMDKTHLWIGPGSGGGPTTKIIKNDNKFYLSGTSYYIALEETNDSATFTVKDGNSNGANIYFVKPDSVAGEDSSGSIIPPVDPDLGTPGHSKVLKDNGDGTYDLTLSVTGNSKQAEGKAAGDVMLVLDSSPSMGLPGIADARSAGVLFAQGLLGSDTNLKLALETFAQTTEIHGPIQGFSSDADYMTAVINNIMTHGGINDYHTDWEAAFKAAADYYTQNSQENAPRYVIFISDGKPDSYDNGKVDNYNEGVIAPKAYTPALNAAKALGKDTKFYLVVVDSDSEHDDLDMSYKAAKLHMVKLNNDLNTDGYYADYYEAASTADLSRVLEQIAKEIKKDYRFTNVEYTDTMTSYTNTGISSVDGTVSGITKKVTDADGNEVHTEDEFFNVVWDESSNTVKLKFTENYKLLGGYTYSATFTVWPDQAAYDRIAELQNELINGDPSTYSQTDLANGIIQETDGGGHVTGYKMKTNASATLDYATVVTVDDQDQEPDTKPTIENIPCTDEDGNDAYVDLDNTSVYVQKLWHATQQASQVEDLAREQVDNPPYLKVSEVTGATQEELKSWNVIPTLPLHGATAGEYVGVDGVFESLYTEYSIAPGILVTVLPDGVSADSVTALTKGGTTYYILDPGHDYRIYEETAASKNFDKVDETHHPMLFNKTLYDVTWDSGHEITSMTQITGNLITAHNYLLGGVNVVKKVVDEDGNPITDDTTTFYLKLTATDQDGEAVTELEYNKYPSYTEEDGKITGTGTQIEHSAKWANNATKEIKPGQLIMLKNVPKGTKVTINEVTADGTVIEIGAESSGYKLNSISNNVPDTGVDYDTSYTVAVTNQQMTREVTILKYATDATTPLNGATFKLLRVEGDTETLVTDTAVGVDANGIFEISNGATGKVLTLTPGDYKLEEQTSPSGYVKMVSGIYFTVGSSVKMTTEIIDGQEVQKTDSKYATARNLSLTVYNEEGKELPMTGGPGTLLYTLSGLMLILASAMMYGFRMRRGERRIK